MGNFLDTDFEKTVTPGIMKIMYVLALVFIVIIGLVTIINGLNRTYGGGQDVFNGILIIIFGPVLVRIYCEIILIFFKMNQTLMDIKNKP